MQVDVKFSLFVFRTRQANPIQWMARRNKKSDRGFKTITLSGESVPGFTSETPRQFAVLYGTVEV